ncbi:FecCD family ABC transporter permease [Actinomadura macrotermitis]|uniref:Putative siderophore transport system permease protein YfiZ n=1 Tax=Actinomadura macrotermitis TaxID=2585200 RepID=A0A7K0BLV3_9ACTN|nr:iron ABC transporter permease [Actinomadura macrotermitis]MQY02160.1 putative siderophore transport system permease protein YfiZ [Actinomadura macrotermitis]
MTKALPAPSRKRGQVPRVAPERGRRRRAWTAALAGALLLAVLLSIALGAEPLGPGEIWHGLWHASGTEGDVIVRSLRLPRTVTALVAGLALGAAGALMQGHTRNPIADPVVLGISAGAGVGVVASLFLLDFTGLYGYVWFGLLGAALAGAGVYAIGALARGGATPVTLALAGAAAHALFTAITAGLVLFDRQALDTYRFWTVGSVSGRPLDLTLQALPLIAAGLALAALNTPGLNALSLGEDVARALGVRIGLNRALGMAAVTLLTGTAVAVCGPIGFVGLVGTHVARHLSGPDYRWIVAQAALIGASLMLAADTLGRLVARPGELQVGIMLALIGAPVFVHLVRRREGVRI